MIAPGRPAAALAERPGATDPPVTPTSARSVRMVVSLVAEAVIRQFGSQAWRDVLERLERLGLVRFDTYDDDELLALVAALPLPAEWQLEERLRWVGRTVVPAVATRYPMLFEPLSSPQEVLLTLSGLLRPLAEEEAELGLAVARQAGGALEVRYRSTRGLCALTAGFIDGVADHLGYEALIEQPICTCRDGREGCLLVCDFVVSPERTIAPSGARDETARTVFIEEAVAPPHGRRADRARIVTRLQMTAVLAASLVTIFLAQELLWKAERVPRAPWEHVFSGLSVTWLIPVLPAVLALVGMALFPWGGRSREDPGTIPNEICFRIVSRGDNQPALFATISRLRVELARQPASPYRIEVITDTPVLLPAGRDLVHFVVPPDYSTTNGTLFKGRALQYAVEHSDLPDDGWVLHLDEESEVTASAFEGVRSAVYEEEASGRHAIGQGAILYHRYLRRYPVLTLADSLRTGDDVGRFYLQHRLGRAVFGLHGSFILARNSVVKEIGFDFGPEGSITEDAFWALVAMDRGYRSRWIDGFLEEQSTRSVMDFLRQRRRWFLGLLMVVRHAPVAWRWRLTLALSVVVWALAWTGILYTYAQLVVGIRAPEPTRWIGNFSFAVYVLLYVLGLRVNLDGLGATRGIKRLGWYVAQVALLPLFAVLEAGGILYALIKPHFGFHVVAK